MSELSVTLPAGALFLETYRVVRSLGQGGQGAVFEAERVADGKRCALKLLRGTVEAVDVARLEREGAALRRLRSPHVVRALDAGVLPDGAPYLVMELLHGRSLSVELRRHPDLPTGRVIRWVREAALGLAEAHAAGLVHRDVKPANIFLAREAGADVARVLDFGLVKDPDATAALTRTLTTFGTPRFMAPEQLVSAKDVDARADVYSLGVVLFFALTGHYPVKGRSLSDLAAEFAKPPPRLDAFRPDLPEPLVDAVARALAVAPEDRWPTMRALADALAPFAESVARARSRTPVLATAALATVLLGSAGAIVAFRHPAPVLPRNEPARSAEIPAASASEAAITAVAPLASPSGSARRPAMANAVSPASARPSPSALPTVDATRVDVVLNLTTLSFLDDADVRAIRGLAFPLCLGEAPRLAAPSQLRITYARDATEVADITWTDYPHERAREATSPCLQRTARALRLSHGYKDPVVYFVNLR